MISSDTGSRTIKVEFDSYAYGRGNAELELFANRLDELPMQDDVREAFKTLIKSRSISMMEMKVEQEEDEIDFRPGHGPGRKPVKCPYPIKVSLVFGVKETTIKTGEIDV